MPSGSRGSPRSVFTQLHLAPHLHGPTLESMTSFSDALRALERVHKQELADLEKLASDQAAQIDLLRTQYRKVEDEAQELREKYAKAQELLGKYKKKFEAWNQKAQQHQESTSPDKRPLAADDDSITKKKKFQSTPPPVTNNTDERPSPEFTAATQRTSSASESKAQSKLRFSSSTPPAPTAAPATTKVISLLESSDDEKEAAKTTKRKADKESDIEDVSGDDNKRPPQKQNYKYHQTGIRKKKEREALPAYECEQCKQWYDAMNSGPNGQVYDRKAMVEQCSRHRAAHAPPSSPPDFWELSL